MNIDFCPMCFTNTREDTCPQCGFHISEMGYSHIELRPGTIVDNRYKIGRVLGIGGFGITYVCYDMQKNKRFAIKEYMPKDVAVRLDNGMIEPNSSSNKDVFDKGLEMFLYETNILITLSGNRGIVEADNFVIANNTGYLVMEYLDGISAKKLMNELEGLDGDLALNILIDVCYALRAVHSKGLLHRDISPENIMILKDGTVKLIDFGASRFFVGERSKSLSLILKHGFAPPEQYSSSGNQGEWTDIYALAATYYKMVSGITIPDALTRATEDTVQRLDELIPTVKPYVGKAIKKALSIKPKDRYKNIDEFVAALKFDKTMMEPQPQPQQPPKEDTFTTAITDKPKKPGFWKRLFGKPEQSQINVEQKQASNVGGGYVAPEPEQITQNDYAPQVNNVPVPQPYVRVVNGSHTLGKWFLPADEAVVIGRDSSVSSIQVLDSSISRRHCVVWYSSSTNTFVMCDESANGVFFSNGARFEKGVNYSLNPGNFVMLATPDYILEVGVQ